jgi:aromatic ring-opening dioxygenase catalytic subunit (LigB family)
MPASVRMPTWFIPHGGGPCFFMDWNPPDEWHRTEAFLRGLASTLPERPKAIVLVSAHWLESEVTAASIGEPELIFDYYGFPPHTYQLQYPAPGSPALAARIQSLLAAGSIASRTDQQRGFDHGVFIPLLLMFPNADIPVVPVSLLSSLDAAAHLRVGQALAPLRDEGVLIVGSGMSFHNMRGYRDPRFAPISDRFDRWLVDAVQSAPQARDQALARWDQAPDARLCHPPQAEEHLLPLMVVAGAAGGDAGRCVFSDRVMQTTVSAFRFG